MVLARGNPDFEYVVENTQAIIFLGTPHRGSTFSSWGRRVAGLLRLVGSNPSILAEIEYDSTMLLDLHLGFEAGIGTETQIVNVFEQRPTLLFRFWFFQWREFVRTSTGSSCLDITGYSDFGYSAFANNQQSLEEGGYGTLACP